jgi:tRNA-2-methylthio-N6-dimethylallyladenosine synthase
MRLPRVCEHLHLPLQSGDDEILRWMGRKYTVGHYKSLVRKLRDRVPGISLTTDLMVGFPGETEEQFENTLQTVQEIRFDAAFTFAFNPRPGTAAAGMADQVEGSVKRRRLSELIAVQNRITLERGEAQVGEVFEVLVEGPSEKDPTRATGYTRTNKTFNFPGDKELTGKLVNVKVISPHPWGYMGERL